MPDIEYSKIVFLAKEEFENAIAKITDTETTLSVATVPDRRLGFLEPLGEFWGLRCSNLLHCNRAETKNKKLD